MPIQTYKPTSPGRRFGSVSDFSEITKKRPEKSKGQDGAKTNTINQKTSAIIEKTSVVNWQGVNYDTERISKINRNSS